MSCARKHRCELAIREPAGCFSPKRYGTIGCIPADVKRVVGSSGISEEDGTMVCPRALKNSKNFDRISIEVMSPFKQKKPTLHRLLNSPFPAYRQAGKTRFLLSTYEG